MVYRGRAPAPVLTLIRLETCARRPGKTRLPFDFYACPTRIFATVWRHEAAFWQIFQRAAAAAWHGGQLTLIGRQEEGRSSSSRWRNMPDNRNSISLQIKLFRGIWWNISPDGEMEAAKGSSSSPLQTFLLSAKDSFSMSLKAIWGLVGHTSVGFKLLPLFAKKYKAAQQRLALSWFWNYCHWSGWCWWENDKF